MDIDDTIRGRRSIRKYRKEGIADPVIEDILDLARHASAIITVCVDRRESYDREIENGLLAAANILLGAHARGLGSVYMSAHKVDEPAVAEEIREALEIPGHMDPISLLPLGYPDESPEPKEMKPLKEIISYETFGRR